MAFTVRLELLLCRLKLVKLRPFESQLLVLYSSSALSLFAIFASPLPLVELGLLAFCQRPTSLQRKQKQLTAGSLHVTAGKN